MLMFCICIRADR